MRWLIAPLALAVAAQAAIPPQPDMAGVWAGTVGTLPVHACLDLNERDTPAVLDGLYYYDRFLAPIQLQETDGQFAERVGQDAPGSARWQFDRLTATTLTGTWRQGAHRLPITLHRLDWAPTDDVDSSPCYADAFHDPRFAGGNWVEEAGWLDGQALVTTNYLVPPPFARSEADDYDKIGLQGLQLVAAQPGDATVNRALAAITSLDSAKGCMAQSLRYFGVDGYWSISILPEVLTDRWLGIVISSSYFCGGAHPDAGQDRQVFDRQSGSTVDPVDWLAPAGFTREWHEPSGGGERYSTDTIAPVLQARVMAHWPRPDDPDDNECRAFAAEPFGWDVGLAPQGLAFIPQLPHVAQACADTMVVPWAELVPFLNDRGRAVMAELSAP